MIYMMNRVIGALYIESICTYMRYIIMIYIHTNMVYYKIHKRQVLYGIDEMYLLILFIHVYID